MSALFEWLAEQPDDRGTLVLLRAGAMRIGWSAGVEVARA